MAPPRDTTAAKEALRLLTSMTFKDPDARRAAVPLLPTILDCLGDREIAAKAIRLLRNLACTVADDVLAPRSEDLRQHHFRN